MKEITMSVVVGLCLFGGVMQGNTADYDPYKTNIKEGLETMIKSPKPFINSVKEGYDAAHFKPFGVFGGALKGSIYSIKEFSTGVFRVLTFNVDDDNVFSNLFK